MGVQYMDLLIIMLRAVQESCFTNVVQLKDCQILVLDSRVWTTFPILFIWNDITFWRWMRLVAGTLGDSWDWNRPPWLPAISPCLWHSHHHYVGVICSVGFGASWDKLWGKIQNWLSNLVELEMTTSMPHHSAPTHTPVQAVVGRSGKHSGYKF